MDTRNYEAFRVRRARAVLNALMSIAAFVPFRA